MIYRSQEYSTMPEPIPSLFTRLDPSEADVELARCGQEGLRRALEQHRAGEIRVMTEGEPGEEVVLPSSALRLLADVMDEIARGNEVVLSSIQRELSTQQAADLLNVSRPYLVGLLEEGKIPFHKVGNRRRVRYAELMEYKRRSDAARQRAIDELARDGQELGWDR